MAGGGVPEDSGDATPSVDQPQRALTLERGTSVGRYVILERLGEGGMGVVYKAYDPELDRSVALKLLQTDKGERATIHRDRLLREAQALARLAHPNVVAVHDVGSLGTQVFIAMEFVDGTTLRRWLEERRSQREILGAFVAAGEGLAAAHRAGLVHRDFKPDNVVIGSDGRVRVLDFGLVRATGAVHAAPSTDDHRSDAALPEDPRAMITAAGLPRAKSAEPRTVTETPLSQPSVVSTVSANRLSHSLTRAGTIMGTPRYMAPEQLRGKEADERADQFSFCVSLYAALYDAFPFEDKTEVDYCDAVVVGRMAEPPKDAHVSARLRAILVRGLATDPAARWPSMEALLAELRRDPAATWRRVAVAAASTMALLTAVSGVGIAVHGRHVAAQQARLGQELGQEVEQIAATARGAALLPLHDLRPELSGIRERMATIESHMRGLGSVASGPGHYALGSGQLALGRWDEAVRELELAYGAGYRSDELSFALGLAHGKLYQRALGELRKSGDAAADAARRQEIAKAHRDPALRHLGDATRSDGGIKGAGKRRYVLGLIALYEGRFADALELARRAAAEAPSLFEARTLEGDVHSMAGKDLWLKGDAAGALKHFAAAGEAYRAASEIARSDFAARIGACQQRVATIRVEVAQHHSPEPTMAAVQAACGAAATARPDEATPLAEEASAFHDLGRYQVEHGVDPTGANQLAVRTAEAALAIEPDCKLAHEVLAYANLAIADYRSDKGDDPRDILERARAHAQRLVEIDPRSFDGYDLLNRIYESLGWYQEEIGGDPHADYELAIENARQTVAMLPNGFPGWNALAAAYWYMGNWQANHGHDPSAAFARAEEAYASVIRFSSTLAFGHANLCSLLRGWAEFERRSAVDPRPRLTRAIASGRQAIAIDQNGAQPQFELGDAFLTWAEWQRDQSVDPMEMLGRARASFRRAVEIDHAHQAALIGLAQAHVVEARWSLAHGRDPEATLADASSWARRALELSGGKSTDALNQLARISRWRGEWDAKQGRGVTADVNEGLDYVRRVVARNPRLAETAALEGALRLLVARTAAAPAARVGSAERAHTALETALSIDGTLAHEYQPLADDAQRLAAR